MANAVKNVNLLKFMRKGACQNVVIKPIVTPYRQRLIRSV